MKFDDSNIAKNISVATEFFKAYQAVKINKQDVKYPGGTTGFIPFNIEFTLDGISGIKIYDKLVIDTSFLPLNYTDTTEFIVTGVDHSLKDGDWETIIKTTLIPKFDETNEIITAKDSNIVTYKLPPSLSVVNSTSPLNLTSEDGPANGIYISPARKADKGDGTNYVDVSKTLSSNTLKSLAEINGGLYPIKLYTKPGDSSGTKYAKVIGFNGQRNSYEPNPTFNSNNIISWTYTGKNGFKQSAKLNKIWGPTLTKIAETLDSKGMWDSNHIKSWSPGIVLRDVSPASGISYGTISAHAFGMAIDINSSQYPLGSAGVAKWKSDFAANIPTALVHDVIQTNFVLNQGGPQKVFWLLDSNDAHHFSVFKKV